MKKIFLIAFISYCPALLAQHEKLALDYGADKFELSSERNETDGIYIYVTNTSVENKSGRIDFKGTEVSKDFTDKILGKIQSLSSNNFKLSKDVTVTTTSFTHDSIVAKIMSPDETGFDSLVSSKLIYKTEGKTFTEYFNLRDGESKPLFKGDTTYTVTKVGEDLKFEDATGTTVQDDSTLFSAIKAEYGRDADFIKKIVLTEEDFLALHNETKIAEILDEYYKQAFGKDDYKFLRNIEAADKVLEVKIKPNNEEKYFNLRMCTSDPVLDCDTTIKIRFDIERAAFKQLTENFINANYQIADSIVPDYDINLLYDDCKKFSEKAIIAEAKKEFQDTISSLIKKIEDLAPQYSGRLTLNDKVRVYDKSFNEVKNKFFYPKYATVRFFNNKAKEIVVVGTYTGKNVEFITINLQYSVPLRAFNNSKQYVPISPNDDDANRDLLNYNDLFQYYPSERTYSYSARNSDYLIKVRDTVKIEQRKLADYFTAVIFSDFLGLNSDKANSLLQAEGRAKIPVWISNWKKFSIFPAVRADLNVTIYNGFDDSSRFITPLNSNKGVADEELPHLTIDYFDYVKFNNVNAGIGIDLLNYEWRGLYTECSLGYGLRYYRAGAKYFVKNEGDETDIEKRYQLNALTHEIWTNFEIRPQINFGADVNIGLNWLNGAGSTDNIPVVYSKDRNNDDKTVLRVTLNLYSKLDPDSSNDGIYARLGGFYHLGQKDFFPQIMVGYATNLSSFVNKFKKE